MKPTVDDLIAAVLVLKEAQDNVDHIKESLARALSPARPEPAIRPVVRRQAKRRPVKSHSISLAVIADAFGGYTKLAEAIESPLATVHGWHQRQRLPHYRHKAIREAASAHGIDLNLLPTQPGEGGLPVGRKIKDQGTTLSTSPEPGDPQGNSLDPAEST